MLASPPSSLPVSEYGGSRVWPARSSVACGTMPYPPMSHGSPDRIPKRLTKTTNKVRARLSTSTIKHSGCYGAEPGGSRMGNRATALGIFLLAFAAFAWLAPQWPGDDQVVTRLGLTLSIVESGRLDIDRFANRTSDKALLEGHYYADKVPGLSFLAIPVVAATTLISRAKGGALDS